MNWEAAARRDLVRETSQPKRFKRAKPASAGQGRYLAALLGCEPSELPKGLSSADASLMIDQALRARGRKPSPPGKRVTRRANRAGAAADSPTGP